MKKLVSLSLILISTLLTGQSNEIGNYSIDAKIGWTFPIQGNYLNHNWDSGPFIGLDLIKKSDPIDFFVGCDYEYLRLMRDKIKFISPHFGILHSFNKGKFYLVPSLSIGYTWLNYTLGKGWVSVPPVTVQEYKQNGISAAFELKLYYALTDKLQLGIGDSYLHIFESFGATEHKPDNSKFIGLYRPYISVLLKI
jgi:hypothetical protein